MAKNVIDKLFALEDGLEAEITDNESDAVRAALLNVQGSLSHLRSTLSAEAAIIR